MQLVFIENNRPVTDSITVAESFGKRHADVLRSYDKIECSQEFNERNFASVEYTDAKGEPRRKIVMSQDGFTFLVFGYTGKEAARFKEIYIDEFHRMKYQLENKVEVLSERKALIKSLRLAAELADEMEEVKEITQAHGQKLIEIEAKVDEQITLDSGDQRKVQKAIARRVYEVESDQSLRSQYFRELHREIKDRWAVASYRDVRRNEVAGLLKYIEAWKPRAA